jgi:Subtilase family
MSSRRIVFRAPRGTTWLVVLATWLVVIASPAATTTVLRRASPDAPASTFVTLVTGDRVHLQTRAGGASTVVVTPAPGREAIAFITQSHKNRRGDEEIEEISVTPTDAIPLLAAGLLDPALFNVTGLVRQGLAGEDGTGPPLILTFDARARAAAVSLTDAGVNATQTLSSINGVAVAHPTGSSGTFWQWFSGGGGPERAAAVAAGRATSLGRAAGVAKVWLDARAQPLLDQSGPQVGLPRARQLGLTGHGVTIAILDSGIKLDHPDFTGRVIASRDFTNTRPDATDDVGHGTHVASIAAGTGAASSGRYQGMAPQASIVNGKVCMLFGCQLSAIIAGMEWAAPQARIINLSLGGDPSDGTDPLSMALDALATEHGTLFVVAAGNTAGPQTVSSPATAEQAFAVGNATKQDAIAPRSSRGPRVGDFAIKPDIAAPGTDIVAARAPGTVVGDDDPVDDNYTRLSGTSMAAPHVAGAAALVLEAHPDWTAAQVRAALTSSAVPLAGATIYDQGAGRLDIGRAVTHTVFASGNLSFGLIKFPQEQPVSTRTVTYTNSSAAPVTLQLALNVTDAKGAPAPSGLFTVDTNTLTVPANGTVDAHVTFDPLPRTPGLFGGRLIATSGSQAIVTAVGASQEVESYDLTVRAVGRASSFFMRGWVANVDTGDVPTRVSLDATTTSTTLRLPKAHYQVDGLIFSTGQPTDPERFTTTIASEPGVMLDADTTVALDATRAQRLTAQIDGVATVPVRASFTLTATIGPNAQPINIGSSVFGSQVAYATPTTRVSGRTYVFTYEPAVGVPAATDYSSFYTLGFFTSGRIPESLAFRARVRDLALLRTDYHVQGVPDTAFRHDFAFLKGLPLSISATISGFPIPSHRDEYFTAHSNVEWDHGSSIGTGLWLDFEDAATTTYRRGEERSVGWNRAPLGPAFSVPGFFGSGRREDAIAIRVGLFSGNQEGHGGDNVEVPGVTGLTTLSRNGVTIGSTDRLCAGTFPVPAEPARFTLTCSGTRNVTQTNLGTHAEATFTFNDPGPNAGAQSLPLLAVRATGQVFAFDSAPAGRFFPLALRVERPLNAARAPITALELEVSYDDGATWTRVPVARLPGSDRALTVLRHPRTPGFVSLRARAADARGNAVTQTMIRAYSLVLVP